MIEKFVKKMLERPETTTKINKKIKDFMADHDAGHMIIRLVDEEPVLVMMNGDQPIKAYKSKKLLEILIKNL